MRRFTLLALAVAAALALAAPLASSRPDGLERVVDDAGVAGRAQERGAPAPGYAVPGVGDDGWATRLAGLGGAALVFAAGTGVAVAARRRRAAR